MESPSKYRSIPPCRAFSRSISCAICEFLSVLASGMTAEESPSARTGDRRVREARQMQNVEVRRFMLFRERGRCGPPAHPRLGGPAASPPRQQARLNALGSCKPFATEFVKRKRRPPSEEGEPALRSWNQNMNELVNCHSW